MLTIIRIITVHVIINNWLYQVTSVQQSWISTVMSHVF